MVGVILVMIKKQVIFTLCSLYVKSLLRYVVLAHLFVKVFQARDSEVILKVCLYRT